MLNISSGEANDIPLEKLPKEFSRSSSVKSTRGRVKKVDESKIYGFLDRARQGIHCSFCGGAKCKYESWESMGGKRCSTAIEGLNSNWVGLHIIASQRLSTSLFPKYHLIEQFKEKQITGVFNLQEKGEHASCGPDGIYVSTGYSYNGEEDLMRHGISYYEFPWPDMTAPQQDIVLRSVQVMDFHVKNSGKVLVHCHAGLGRTGLMIACYFVYTQHMPSTEVIKFVRQMRPGAIQSSKQAHFIHDFECHLRRLSVVFPMKISDAIVDIEFFLQRQRLMLHGEQADYYRFIPMVLHVLLCRLLNLIRAKPSAAKIAILALAPSASPEEAILSECRLSINRRCFNVNAMANVGIIGFLVGDWFRSMSIPALTDKVCGVIRGNWKATSERDSLPKIIACSMSKSVRHTLGMVISAFYVISSHVDATITSYAFRCLADSFTHAHNPTVSSLNAAENDFIYEFFCEWAESIQDRYFNLDRVDKAHATVYKIAFVSSIILDETKHTNLQLQSLSFHPADLDEGSIGDS